MPMFSTPKPRQFHYQPRFYDPEKERWEALKQKYAEERALRELLEQKPDETVDSASVMQNEPSLNKATNTLEADDELDYFRRRVRELDANERREKHSLGWQDIFRKREMPKFKYQPRFVSQTSTDSNTAESHPQSIGERIDTYRKQNIKIRRRFDNSDPNYLKPVPATRILLYTALVCLLIYICWIVTF